jgi:hypothetical protein
VVFPVSILAKCWMRKIQITINNTINIPKNSHNQDC